MGRGGGRRACFVNLRVGLDLEFLLVHVEEMNWLNEVARHVSNDFREEVFEFH